LDPKDLAVNKVHQVYKVVKVKKGHKVLLDRKAQQVKKDR
jgi:hypothetical protein